MGACVDFMNWLDSDMSLKIFMCLDDPSDIVRVSCVSRSWHHFAIANGLCKQLCLRLFPPLHRVHYVTDPRSDMIAPPETGCSKFVEWENLEKEHRVYAFLARGCASFLFRELISEAVIASSTDNYPEESIENTLEPRERIARRASYWSSKGQSDPMVPETLIYKLVSNICVISEISIKPFQAFFQLGSPIYSAKSLRFRMGYSKVPLDGPIVEPADNLAGDNFVWTYTSPIFPMAQENRLQNFKLPEPVLCIGGMLQIELLGRVQRQEMDGLYYICVCHVQAMGRSLSPSFDVEILKPLGMFVLKAHSYSQPSLLEDQPHPAPSGYLQRNARHLDMIVNILQGHGVDFEAYDWIYEQDDEEEDDLDEEFANAGNEF